MGYESEPFEYAYEAKDVILYNLGVGASLGQSNGLDGWHVDHIKPLHEFNLDDEEEFEKASHYTNLQPLWWWQNLEKNRGTKYK